MTKDELYELARTGMATGAGALDETAFGVPSTYIPAISDLKKESPTAFTVGQVGSYFIPGTGIVGGAELLGKLARVAMGAGKGAKEASALMRVLKAAGMGAAEGGGQVAVRRALGTGNGDIANEAVNGGTAGAVLGGISPALGSLAKTIYSHPAIFNARQKGTKASELIDRLMREGVSGGENTFRNKAEELKEGYSKILDPYRKKYAGEAANIEDVLAGFKNRMKGEAAAGDMTNLRQFKKTEEGARASLGPFPFMGEALDHQKLMNEKLAGLAGQKRAAAVTGVAQDGGRVASKDAAFGAMKGSIEDLEKGALERTSGQEGLDALKKAKESYGSGRELERALDRPAAKEGIGLPAGISAATGIASAVSSGGVGLGQVLAALGAGGATVAGKTLRGRTNIGLGLNKIAQNPGGAASKIARVKERMNRDEPAYKMGGDQIAETPTGAAWRSGEDPFSGITQDDNRLIKDQPKKDPFADIGVK